MVRLFKINVQACILMSNVFKPFKKKKKKKSDIFKCFFWLTHWTTDVTTYVRWRGESMCWEQHFPLKNATGPNKGSRFKGTHQSASLATHSVWVTSKQLFGCSSHRPARTPPPPTHPLQHLPVWMAAAFSGALNGPQSAGEIRMLGAREGGRARGTGGLCLPFGAFKWASGEWRLPWSGVNALGVAF